VTPALEEELARLRSRHDAQPAGRTFAPLADCYRKLGRLNEALDFCLAGIQKHPTYSTAHVILGKIHRDRGEPEAAFRAFERVVGLDEMNLLARRECALLGEELGQIRESYEHWNRLLAGDPGNAEAEAAIERLADSPSLGEPVASAQNEEPGVEDESEARPTARAAVLESRLDAAEQEELPTSPSGELAGREAEIASEAKARGIATITLAHIYYDQGFKAKALEVYERVLGQNPGDAELIAKVETIRAELAQIESRAADRASDAGDLLEAARAEAPWAKHGPRELPGPDTGDIDVSREVEVLAASIEATDPQREDYSQFRSWLNRVRQDD
jgi:tetratricopeptide (TPR) repeat protein